MVNTVDLFSPLLSTRCRACEARRGICRDREVYKDSERRSNEKASMATLKAIRRDGGIGRLLVVVVCLGGQSSAKCMEREAREKRISTLKAGASILTTCTEPNPTRVYSIIGRRLSYRHRYMYCSSAFNP